MSDSSATHERETTWLTASRVLQCRLELRGGVLRWQLARNGANTLPVGWAPLATLALDGRTPIWRHGERMETNHTEGLKALTVELQTTEARGRLRVTIELFDDMPFVRTSALLTNTGKQPVTVSGAEMLRLALSGSETHALFHVEQFSWPYHSNFFSQRQAELVIGPAPQVIR